MPKPLLIAAFGCLLVGSATAQVRLTARLGATWSSSLVKDQIVASPITVKPGIAPTLSLGASMPWGRKYRLGLDALITTGSVDAAEPGITTDLGSLRTAAIMLTAEGPAMVKSVRWRVGVGLLKYLPSEKQGLFRDGGPSRVVGGVGAEYVRPWKPGWEWVAGLRYAYHQFTTAALKARGFSQTQDVHRVWLEVGVARYFQ